MTTILDQCARIIDPVAFEIRKTLLDYEYGTICLMDDRIDLARIKAKAIIETVREECAVKAREWAEHYSPGSDGRNTFILFAEWAETLQPSEPAGQSAVADE
jgi:hypothetical protein